MRIGDTFYQDVFEIAHEIANKHVKRGWFESETSAIVREIRLRQAIYDAIVEERCGKK